MEGFFFNGSGWRLDCEEVELECESLSRNKKVQVGTELKWVGMGMNVTYVNGM